MRIEYCDQVCALESSISVALWIHLIRISHRLLFRLFIVIWFLLTWGRTFLFILLIGLNYLWRRCINPWRRILNKRVIHFYAFFLIFTFLFFPFLWRLLNIFLYICIVYEVLMVLIFLLWVVSVRFIRFNNSVRITNASIIWSKSAAHITSDWTFSTRIHQSSTVRRMRFWRTMSLLHYFHVIGMIIALFLLMILEIIIILFIIRWHAVHKGATKRKNWSLEQFLWAFGLIRIAWVRPVSSLGDVQGFNLIQDLVLILRKLGVHCHLRVHLVVLLLIRTYFLNFTRLVCEQVATTSSSLLTPQIILGFLLRGLAWLLELSWRSIDF